MTSSVADSGVKTLLVLSWGSSWLWVSASTMGLPWAEERNVAIFSLIETRGFAILLSAMKGCRKLSWVMTQLSWSLCSLVPDPDFLLSFRSFPYRVHRESYHTSRIALGWFILLARSSGMRFLRSQLWYGFLFLSKWNGFSHRNSNIKSSSSSVSCGRVLAFFLGGAKSTAPPAPTFGHDGALSSSDTASAC